MTKKIFLFSCTVVICLLLIPILLKVINSNQIERESVTSQNTEKMNVNTSIEWPQLYPGITWNATNTGMVEEYFVDPQKDVIVNQLKPDISDITNLGQQVENYSYTIAPNVSNEITQQAIHYYENWFNNHGWQEDINAGGPTGDEFGFLSNGKRFLINIPYTSKDLSKRAIIIEHN